MYNLFPVAFMDSPQVLVASITNIPGSASLPLQVVSDLGFINSMAIDYIDSTGDYIGVYVGASGQEILRCIIGGGVTARAYSQMPAHSRICLRSMSTSPITNGQLMCAFMGA